MAEHFMGIDNGGTMTKAVIYDIEGKAVASASRKVPVLMPAPGFTERDMEALWNANCEVIREAISVSGLDPSDIAGLACTGHGKGLYLWGKDGKPAHNGIISTDSRARVYPDRWNSDGTAAGVRDRTCQSVLASQPVSILRWLSDNDPSILENVRWIFAVKDYIRFRLTGEAFAEITDYSGSGLMNIRDCRFDRDILEAFGIGRMFPALPPLRGSTECCGYITEEAAALTGLARGTPVAGGMFDIDACALAVGVTDEERMCVIAGTWSINEYISRTPVTDGSIMMNSLFCMPGYYLVEECSPTSAGNNEWFASLFLDSERAIARERGTSVYEVAGELAASVPPDGQNIVFLPYIYGSNYNPRAKACFVGLEASHTRAQVIRSVYEGIALGHKVHVDKLLAGNSGIASIRLAGGAAKSPLWAQMFADVLELPVETVESDEPGTAGCAMAAAVASGAYPDLRTASARMTKVRARYEPDLIAALAYRRKFDLHKRISGALDPIWQDF